MCGFFSFIVIVSLFMQLAWDVRIYCYVQWPRNTSFFHSIRQWWETGAETHTRIYFTHRHLATFIQINMHVLLVFLFINEKKNVCNVVRMTWPSFSLSTIISHGFYWAQRKEFQPNEWSEWVSDNQHLSQQFILFHFSVPVYTIPDSTVILRVHLWRSHISYNGRNGRQIWDSFLFVTDKMHLLYCTCRLNCLLSSI